MRRARGGRAAYRTAGGVRRQRCSVPSMKALRRRRPSVSLALLRRGLHQVGRGFPARRASLQRAGGLGLTRPARLLGRRHWHASKHQFHAETIAVRAVGLAANSRKSGRGAAGRVVPLDRRRRPLPPPLIRARRGPSIEDPPSVEWEQITGPMELGPRFAPTRRRGGVRFVITSGDKAASGLAVQSGAA